LRAVGIAARLAEQDPIALLDGALDIAHGSHSRRQDERIRRDSQ
jgi:hypothetical protein